MKEIKKELKRLKHLAKDIFGIKVKYSVEWVSSTNTIGQCRYLGKDEKFIFSFNKYIYKQVGFNEFKDTIVHEFAHAVTNCKYPYAKPHGSEWKNVMRSLGAKNISARSKKFLNIKRKPSDKEVFCKCSTHIISTRMYNSIKNGERYICKKCSSLLKTKKEKK